MRPDTDTGVARSAAAPWTAVATLLALGAAVLLRLAMTGDRDILALNQGYDDFWFVSTADHGIWGGPYNQLTFAHLPVYPIWLFLTSQFGIPARLAIDLSWIGASSYLAVALNRLLGQRWPGWVLFAFLAFHPFSIALFDRALSENLLVCLAGVCLAAAIDIWNFRDDGPRPSAVRRRVAIATASVAFALAYHCRKESVVLLPIVAALAAATLFARARWWSTGWRSPGIVVFGLPLAATITLGVFLAGMNQICWGVFARHELGATGYVRAMRALIEIDPGMPTPRFVTVTAATRKRAYAVSPTFAELHDFLDGPGSERLTTANEIETGVHGEIGNGWFYWTIRDAAATRGWHRSAVEAERKYDAMANEIAKAFDDGRLPRRFAPLPFIDPDWRKWLPSLPMALVLQWRDAVVPTARSMYRLPEDATTEQREVFTKIVGRRRPFGRVGIDGWLAAPEGTRIGLTAAGLPERWIELTGVGSPIGEFLAFHFHLEAPGEAVSSAVFVELPNGARRATRVSELGEGRITTIPGAPPLQLGVDRIMSSTQPPWVTGALPKWSAVWAKVGWTFTALGVAGLIVGLARSRQPTAPTVLLAIAFVAILARLGLFAVLDVTSWNGGSRYLLPIVPMIALLGPVGACALIDAIRAGRPVHVA